MCRRVPYTLLLSTLCMVVACKKTTLSVENATGGPIEVTIQDVAKSSGAKGKQRKASPIVHTIADKTTLEIKLSVPVLNDKATVPVDIKGDYVSLKEDVEVIVGETNPKKIEATGGVLVVTNNLKKDITNLYAKHFEGAAAKFFKMDTNWGEDWGPVKVGATKRIGGLAPGDNWHLKRAKGLATALGPFGVEMGKATTVEISETGVKTSNAGKELGADLAKAVHSGVTKTFDTLDEGVNKAATKLRKGKHKPRNKKRK